MDEKTSIADTLASINSMITQLTYSAEQANNKQFRESLISFRGQFDAQAWDCYQIAKLKGYYTPAAPAGEADIKAVKDACNK